jgi:translocation and assembly module TamA
MLRCNSWHLRGVARVQLHPTCRAQPTAHNGVRGGTRAQDDRNPSSMVLLRRARPSLLILLSYGGAICVLAYVLPGRAADPVTYTVKIAPTGDKSLDAALGGSSQLNALRTMAPAGPFALVARARQDIGRLGTALQSYGYYQARITLTINGKNLDDPNLPDALQALPQTATAAVTVGIDKGPLYHLRHVTLDGAIPPAAHKAFTLKPGDPAIASTVLAAGNTLLAALQEQGYALAKVLPPSALAIPQDHALDVTFHVDTGARVDLGPISITGLRRMREWWVRRRLLIHQGQLYQPSKIEAAREDLASVGAFSGIRISAAKNIDPAGQLPLRVDVTERKLHTITATVAYSTDLGGSAGFTWSHHDLFGHAEKLNLTAEITGLGGTADQGLGYLAKAQFLKPDFEHRDQTLDLSIEALKQDLQSYNQTAVILAPTLRRKLSPIWTASVGLSGIEEQILQEGTTRDYTLLAAPMTVQFDNTRVKSPLDDPLHGLRATFIATPTESFARRSQTFVILQGQASTYVDLTRLGIAKPGMSVIALRGLVGSVQGASDFDLPPDQRFYGGGSGTIRGFKYQSVGPQFPDGYPIGGTSIDAATIELRQRIWGNIGAAAFVDAGQVAERSAPFQGRLVEGAGIGARYYTPIGPLRLDFAVPLETEPHGDSFEIYLGLGEAF